MRANFIKIYKLPKSALRADLVQRDIHALESKLNLSCAGKEKLVYKKVLVPLDGSERAECVLPQIETMIRESPVSDIFFVSVVRPVSVPQNGEHVPIEKAFAEDYLEALVDGFEYNDTRLHVDVIVGGGIAESLAEYAANIGVDLIVLASHGESGEKGRCFGDVADRVMRITSIPVLIVSALASITGT